MDRRIASKTCCFANAILEHMPVAVAVYDTEEFRLLEANRLFLTTMERFLDPSWHQGRIIGVPLADWTRPIAIAGLVAIFRAVAETGTAYQAVDFAFPTSDSITYWNWSLQRMEDHDGQVVRLLQTINDVTAQVQAHQEQTRLQKEIEHNQAHLRTILDQLPEGVFLTEAADGRIRYANPAAASIMGYPLTMLLGAPLAPLHQSVSITDLRGWPVPPEQFATVRAFHGEIVNGKEEIIIMPDGRRVILLSSAAPLRTEQGEITGAVTVFQDITERKRLEQQKNHFVSMASHELRTPITAIQGLAEILQLLMDSGQSLTGPRGARAIHGIVEQSQRLVRLIEDMLDLSRLDQAQLYLYPAPHDLHRTLVQVIESQAVTTKQHDLRLVLSGLREGETLMGCFDEERLIQVFSNLISNAIKYSPGGGEIEIGLQHTPEQPDEALIWVRDHGIGIPPDTLPHIFERFYRSDKLDRGISGLGIGLYLVREIINRHGGRVWAESSEGSGSTFYVRLPLGNCQGE